MRQIPPALQAHLDTGQTTLCWCWRVTRSDGTRLGFTDHDRDLTFDSTTYEAASGLTAGEARESVGLSVDNQEIEGALRSDRLSAADLEAGLYDNAAIEIFRVNWADVAERALIRAGTLGEVRRGPASFAAEVRGLAHLLQQEKGRIYQYVCDADLGDTRCGINLEQPAFRGDGAVVTVTNGRRFTASGLGGFSSDWFTRGRLTWTSGANTGRSADVKLHTLVDGTATVESWISPSEPIAAGDAFIIRAGCDKQLATCKAKFTNVLNYRGFPHMPGNDFIATYPNRGDTNDGRPVT
jgi:uncharacterized phage protein (TIGR02218 family)